MRKNLVFLLLILTVISATALLIGCGGSSPEPRVSTTLPAATGRATLTVRWPEPSRLIPFASESIYVRLSRGTQLFGERLLVRPTNGGTVSATFDRVPTGAATVAAVALPNADGTGTAQAQGSVPVTVVANQTATVQLTLGSTIDRLTLSPSTTSLKVGESIAAAVTAYNAQNEAILIKPATVTWASGNTTIVTVEAGGKIKALARGTTTITATETESGKTATISVNIASAPTPISWWRGDGNTLDSTGGNNGTAINDVKYAAGLSGQAFDFNGVDTAVTVPDNDSLKLTSSMTIDVWIKPRSFPSGGDYKENSMIVHRGDWRGRNDAYFLGLTPQSICFGIDRNDYERAFLTAPITLNEWHHVTATVDGTSGKMMLYMDGSLVGETVVPFPRIRDLDPNYNPGVGIGNHPGYPNSGGYEYAFDGLIDELKIYDVVVPPQI